jgi:CspA family cold shock protein
MAGCHSYFFTRECPKGEKSTVALNIRIADPLQVNFRLRVERGLRDPSSFQIRLQRPAFPVALNFTGRVAMASGTVKWFNPTKGFGFIQPSDGGKDAFVHISAVERAGLTTLNEGQQIEYEIITDRGKRSAGNLKVK